MSTQMEYLVAICRVSRVQKQFPAKYRLEDHSRCSRCELLHQQSTAYSTAYCDFTNSSDATNKSMARDESTINMEARVYDRGSQNSHDEGQLRRIFIFTRDGCTCMYSSFRNIPMYHRTSGLSVAQKHAHMVTIKCG